MVYLITYDLNQQGQNYDDLIKTIKESSHSWCSFWKSSYLVRSSLTLNQFESKITQYLDSNDRLIIVEASSSYGGWLTEDQWQFIRENIFI